MKKFLLTLAVLLSMSCFSFAQGDNSQINKSAIKNFSQSIANFRNNLEEQKTENASNILQSALYLYEELGANFSEGTFVRGNAFKPADKKLVAAFAMEIQKPIEVKWNRNTIVLADYIMDNVDYVVQNVWNPAASTTYEAKDELIDFVRVLRTIK